MTISKSLLKSWFKIFKCCKSKTSKNCENHCVKTVRIQSFSGPYFPALRLNTKKYFISLRIQSECGKIQTSKTPNTDFSRCEYELLKTQNHDF